MRLYFSQEDKQNDKMVDMILCVSVLIKQSIPPCHVIQLPNSTGCLFLITDGQRKNREGFPQKSCKGCTL